jgi:flagellar M-ring protein FliF
MSDSSSPRQLPVRLIAIVFGVVFGLLALGYFLFLRPGYVPVFSDLRPAEASAVAAQLDSKNIAYRLADNGATIAVSSDQADQARLLIAGSDVALKGGVGFELFNKSDMGLTDFAQRINYQRALQGELERTIMMIDEVETARVHLAMPERSLFRSERSPSKAAVELIAKPGRQLDDERVAGIQRLVAFAVPDLAPADVVIVDEGGRVLSQSSAQDALLSPDAEEQQAVQRYYRARARAAVEPALPGIQTDVRVVVLGEDEVGASIDAPPATTPTPAASAGPGIAAAPTPAGRPDAATAAPRRNFRLRIIVATAIPLDADQTRLVRNEVAAAVGLDEAAGDELAFRVGLSPANETTPAARTAATPIAAVPPSGSAGAASFGGMWLYLVIGVGLLLLAAVVQALRPSAQTSRLSPDEREAMIERIRAALRDPEIANAG